MTQERFDVNLNINNSGGGSAFAGGAPPSSPSGSLLINNPQLNLMASYLREINAGTHGMSGQMEKAMSGMGIKFNLAGILKQSQLFTGVIGSVFQILGAAVDIILAAFMPILIPAIRAMASALPRIREYVERYLTVGVEWLVKIWQWISGDKTQEGIRTTLDAFTPDWLPFKDNVINWLSEWKNLGILAIAFALRGKVGKLLLNVGSVATTLTNWILAGPRWIGKLLNVGDNFKWLTKYVLQTDVIGGALRTFGKATLWTSLKTGFEPILKVMKMITDVGTTNFRAFFKIPKLAPLAVTAAAAVKAGSILTPAGKVASVLEEGVEIGIRTGSGLVGVGKSGALLSADELAHALERGLKTVGIETLTATSGLGKNIMSSPTAMKNLVVEALKIAPAGTKIGSKAFAKGLLPLVGALIIFAEAVGDTFRNYNQMRDSGAGVVPAALLASFTALAGTINSIVAAPFPLVGWGTSEFTNYLENQMFNWFKGDKGVDRSIFDYTDIGAVKSIYLSIFAPDQGTVEHLIDAQTLEQGFTQNDSSGSVPVRMGTE